jgi:hypothetical protein
MLFSFLFLVEEKMSLLSFCPFFCFPILLEGWV